MAGSNVHRFGIAPVFDNILPELRALDAWVVWLSVPKGPGQKPRKIPYAPWDLARSDPSDPTRVGSYDDCVALYASDPRIAGALR